MEKFNFLDYYTVEYPEKSGKKYMFNPYLFGRGAWTTMRPDNKPGEFVPSSQQKTLNQFFFSRPELPYVYERFKNLNIQERKKLKDISMSWLNLKMKALTQTAQIEDIDVLEGNGTFKHGMMYTYIYDAKYKNILPKWDAFPLTIVLEKRTKGFLGLNLHYLPINERSVLLGKMLQSYSAYNKQTDKLKLTLDYSVLKESGQMFNGYEKCVKEYLYDHIRSKILPIESHEWMYAILLPTANFHYKK